MSSEESDDFVVQLLRENRRLKTELQRRDAIASSRWWRLHPRLNLQRLFAALRRPRDPPPVAPSMLPRESTTATVPSDLVSRFRHEVVEHGAFSQDWFTEHIASWEPMMEALEGRDARVLEIGAFEGLSTCYLLWRLPDAHVTAVDTFAGSSELVARDLLPVSLEQAFDANVGSVDGSRARKLVGDSRRVLLDLHDERARFDFVYVDGSHVALDVLVDAALSWSMLTVDGFLVFDDYGWSAMGPDPLLRPGPAIDAFLHLVAGKYELLGRGTQLTFRKTSV
jgi:predicted O-methyltransferase YrrM